MHAWLLDHRDAVSEEAVLSQAAALGLDRAAFAQTSASAAVEAAIQEDCQGAKQVGMTAVPTVYVNGRFVPRLRLPGADPMSLILNAAAAEARGGGPGTTP
jgi:predicted DsbA family dithiol-disulfide isomerase